MPSLDASHISSKILEKIGQCTLIGPITQGFTKPIQIVHLDSSVEELTNMAAFALSEVK
jgi:malate dehydrogenase (oxaloacetate-decarboxylating)(NADP+)